MLFPLVSDPHFVSVFPPMGTLFPLLKRTEVSTLAFLFLELYVIYELDLGLISTFHVYIVHIVYILL